MSRKKRAEGLEEDEPGLDISSLIDVCFLLLIYFITTSTIQVTEQDVPLQLPGVQASAGAVAGVDPLFIKLDEAGAVFLGAGSSQEALDFDAASRELPLLDQRLELYSASASAADQKPLVQLYIEGQANQQRVVDVLNALAKHQIREITFTDLYDE